jgi:hypothetical protein
MKKASRAGNNNKKKSRLPPRDIQNDYCAVMQARSGIFSLGRIVVSQSVVCIRNWIGFN